MEVDTLQQLLADLGFPVVMVGACGVFIWKMYQAQLLDKDKLYEQLMLFRETNTNLAETITQLTTNTLENQEVNLKAIKDELSQIKEKMDSDIE
ncbi:hypothetical protein AN641_06415 [Candidatus Epulonipiscioides gigas]|nr:hypothetical protein AN641_08975 [Epulopiscium sp. SCG-C07WGA-EpuloA2]ONI44616.1 hypothetical protein AN641_06415 [Epulopiscium sp. SCG-C07WGA-EpuloA2]